MKKLLFLIAVIVSLVYGSTAFASQQVVYVQSVKAKILREPSFKSKIMAEVGRGHKFESTGQQGNWMKVKYDFEEGYVSTLLLSTHPPLKKQGLIKAEDTELKTSVRRRASTYTSAAAARGLTQESRRRLSKEEKADYYSIEKIEAFTISDGDLERFIAGGKI